MQRAAATSAHTPAITKKGRQAGLRCSMALDPCHPIAVPVGAPRPAGSIPQAHQRFQVGGRSPHPTHRVVAHGEIPIF
eukprot:44358-Pyramimonas_sp.AAC.1